MQNHFDYSYRNQIPLNIIAIYNNYDEVLRLLRCKNVLPSKNPRIIRYSDCYYEFELKSLKLHKKTLYDKYLNQIIIENDEIICRVMQLYNKKIIACS